MNETRQLSQFVAETTFDDLPADLIDRMKVYTLDNIASGFVGTAQPWSRIVAETTKRLGGHAEVSMFGQSWKADVSRAALVNGAMIGAFEVEHVGHSAHPGGTVFPATLALAERNKLNGKAFLLAMTLGYEIVCRVGDAHTRSVEDERGFHNPGVNGVFGSAAASAKLLGLDAQQTAWAMGIAGSHSAGLVEFIGEGAMTKRLHLGRASQMGLESALLASSGFTGPTTVLEGNHGFLQAYSPTPRPEALLQRLGEEWVSRDLTVKAYPCHVTGQAITHAILKHLESNPVNPNEIKSVSIIGTSRIASPRHGEQSPTTVLGGQYSLPFTVAMAFTRDMADPLAFDESAINDPLIRSIAANVHIESDDSMGTKDGHSARIVLDTDRESTTIHAYGFPGSLDEPLDYDGAVEKFRSYTRSKLSAEVADEILNRVSVLERIDDVSDLAKLIAFT